MCNCRECVYGLKPVVEPEFLEEDTWECSRGLSELECQFESATSPSMDSIVEWYLED